MAAALLLNACGRDAPEPPKMIDAITVSIDAANNCTLEKQAVDCAGVAAAIRSRYPTSKPRVDICLKLDTRYEAAVEVMKSVNDAGFTVGKFECRPGTAG